MNQQELNHIIQSPNEISAASATELIALCEKYPWFSAPHTLLANYFARTNDFRKDEWLTRAASRIHNREWLYYFMQPEGNDLPVETPEINEITLESLSPEPHSTEPELTEFLSLEVFSPEPIIAESSSSDTQSDQITSPEPQSTEFISPMAETVITPLFQPAEEYDIAKAMGTTFNFEPVDFNETPDEIEPPQTKNFRPYNLEEFLSLGLIENNEEESKTAEIPIPTAAQSENLDFFDWLARKNSDPSPSNKAVTMPNEGPNTKQNLDKFGLINQFIEKQPSISRPKQEFYSPERAMKRSETFSPGIVTETLANIFRTQGHFEKAIISYQKLQLKFPEKSAYFASLIEQIKKEQNQ
ncbi:MAG: hypothetical protein ACO3AQ_02250 [Bacteroidia bacterium]